MKLTHRDAILAAISYADIFDYPLTPDELSVWIPFLKRPRVAAVGSFVHRLMIKSNIYYSIRSTKRLITIRDKRAAWSTDKWARARRVANVLKLIPTIKLVGVTGGLTRSNATVEDDIDFLIITSNKAMWVTRALSTILLDIFRLRRRPADTQLRNLVCLNMFMSENGLRVPVNERDLFTAHEVLLMTTLWQRDNTHTKFLHANRWVRKFLPNAWDKQCQMINDKWPMKKQNKLFSIWHLAFSIFEQPCKLIQMWYMRDRRTTEVVSNTVIRFHPRDARVWIKSALGQRLSHFNIPLDKIFYGR